MPPLKTESGVQYEPSALDATRRRFWRELWQSVPEAAAAEHGIELATFGPVQATAVRATRPPRRPQPDPRRDRAGRGRRRAPRGRSGLDARAGRRSPRAVDPGLPTSEDAEALLRIEGLAPGPGWVEFVRDAHLPRFAPADDVEVVEVTDPGAEPFGAIVAAAFELPAWGAELFASLPGREGWRCYVAKVDGAAHAAGAMLLDGHLAELGIGATLEPARRRGCQLALLHRRIIDAADAGARLLFVETAERAEDRPADSFSNILKAGFESAYLCPSWGAESV